MWTNYHCHTNFCDGKKPVADVVSEAKKLGMLALGISSHAPLPFPAKWCMKPEMLDAYLGEIADARSKTTDMQIYAGLEVDYIPDKVSPHTFKDKLDYTVGSVHFVDQLPNGEGWGIDGTYEVFMGGLVAIYGGSIRQAINRYFTLTREMVINATPDVVGHIDKIKMHNRGDHFYQEAEPWYKQEVKQTLDVVAKAGCIIEVNTRGLYQSRTDDPYPSPWILQEILDRNIPITLSSDAHHPDDLVNRFTEVAGDLLSIGFKKLRILLDGRWTDVPFDQHGIISPNNRNLSHHTLA
ncbi:MAG TPA: histidinol-phosphatase [Cyclobacteriaceae bacterium]|nr:histidinol-phosphatase [Cyclobacteriaceae bacterium]